MSCISFHLDFRKDVFGFVSLRGSFVQHLRGVGPEKRKEGRGRIMKACWVAGGVRTDFQSDKKKGEGKLGSPFGEGAGARTELLLCARWTPGRTKSVTGSTCVSWGKFILSDVFLHYAANASKMEAFSVICLTLSNSVNISLMSGDVLFIRLSFFLALSLR